MTKVNFTKVLQIKTNVHTIKKIKWMKIID